MRRGIAAPPSVDRRGWLVGRYKVGQRVRIVGSPTDAQATVARVLQINPRTCRYQLEENSSLWFESDLAEVPQ